MQKKPNQITNMGIKPYLSQEEKFNAIVETSHNLFEQLLL